MSVLLFFIVLFVLILVHEWGHFIAAKKTGMRVDEFGIGFPPKLFGVRKGETEYTFNALPIGGFVRIFGENSEEAVAVSEVDAARAFNKRPRLAQAIVLIAGVTMNVLFAWFLFAVTYMVGVPTAVDEATAGDTAVLYISGVLPGSPLAEVVPAGAQIIGLENQTGTLETLTPTAFSEFIQASANTEVALTYRFGDTEETVTVVPTTGLIPDDIDRVAVGVSLAMVETKQSSFWEAIQTATIATYEGLINITVGLTTLLVDAVRGSADLSQVAGPVGIVGMVGDAATFGITALLTFTAMISLNLAVINMLPIPALDGGRLLFVGIEAVTQKPINPIWMGRVNLIGFALLMLLMVLVTWNDIAKLL